VTTLETARAAARRLSGLAVRTPRLPSIPRRARGVVAYSSGNLGQAVAWAARAVDAAAAAFMVFRQKPHAESSAAASVAAVLNGGLGSGRTIAAGVADGNIDVSAVGRLSDGLRALRKAVDQPLAARREAA